MVNVSKVAGGGDKNEAGKEHCGLCGAAVTWVWLAVGKGRTKAMVSRCGRGAGDVAIEAPLFAFGAEQTPGAYPATGTSWRKHVCNRMAAKARGNPHESPSISYRPKGSVNSRGRK